MVFRILTVVLILLTGIVYLTDSQQLVVAKRLDRFDNEILLELLYKKKKAMADFDLGIAKSMFSKNVHIEISAPDGEVYRGGYKELMGYLDDYGKTGAGYDRALLNHAVMVAFDGLSAVVTMDATESWQFEDNSRNFSGHLVETQHWILENGFPKIAGMRREQTISDPYFLQRRER